jgi:hypothetical protein
VRYVLFGAGVVALVLGLMTARGEPRCAGRPMDRGEWCTGVVGQATPISYQEREAQLDDVSRTALGLAVALGSAGVVAVVAGARRRRARTTLASRARAGPGPELARRAAGAGLGEAVASGVAAGGEIVHLFERGAVVEGSDGQSVVAWHDLVAVYESLAEDETPPPVSYCRLVTADDAVDLRADPGDPIVGRVADAASASLDQALLAPVVEALDEGRSLLFGPLVVDSAALYRSRRRRPTVVPWERVVAVAREVRVVRGAASSRLGVTYQDARRPARRRHFTVDLLTVPNASLLVALAEAWRGRRARAAGCAAARAETPDHGVAVASAVSGGPEGAGQGLALGVAAAGLDL